MMMLTISRPRAVALLLPLLLAASSGCDIAMADFSDQETAEWRKTFELQPGGRLEIGNVNGKIDVTPGQGNVIEIVAKKVGKASSKEAAKQALDRIRITDTVTGGVIKVETTLDRSAGGMFDHSSRQVEYTIRVPAGAELKLTTVNGGVEIAGITGRITAQATNGGIKARDIGGSIEATTTNGGVELDLTNVPEGGVKLECTNGGIKLRLPSDGKASISARITNGGIDTDGINLQTRGESSRRRVEGDLNGGGPRISLEGTNGGIRISGR
jgi:DUF4097 and DUF4098 domain-containing protein YvlB